MCVCAICDRWVLRHATTLLTTHDQVSLKTLRGLLDPAGLDLPMELSRQYDCSDIDPAFGGMLLSRKRILPAHDGTPSQLRVCDECNDQHFYSNIQMAENGENADSQIADAVLDFEKVVPTSDVTSVDEDQARVGAENDLEVATGPDDECEMIERSVVFVNEVADPNKMHPVTELPAHSESSQRRFLVRNSSQFTVDSDGSIYAKMFPHLFPYGRGHPGEQRPVPVSVDACIKCYSMHSSRRFADDETLLLVAFDRLSTQRMFMQISLTCKRHPDLFRGYDTITHEQLSVALHQNELRQQGRLAVDLRGNHWLSNFSEA